jgi:hypothetical protein
MSGRHPLRTVLLGATLIAIGGCAAAERPFTSTVRREVLIQASHDEVFDAVLDAIDFEALYVDRVDHHVGVVTTRAIGLTRNVPSEIEDMCLPFGLQAGPLDSASYSLRVVVMKESAHSSTVQVTPRFRFLLSDTPEKWHECPVEGPLERDLVREIERNVDLDPRDRVN